MIALAGPAAAQQPNAQAWTRYAPLVEQVQAVDGLPVPGGGMYAIVIEPTTGRSRLDWVDSGVRDHYQQLEPAIPTGAFGVDGRGYTPSANMALSVESNDVTDAYVTVGNPNGTSPSPLAGVYMRWHDDFPAHWIQIAAGTAAPMIAPWGIAFGPEKSVFVADARGGTILHVPDFLGPRTGKVRISSQYPEYRPVGPDEALPGLSGRSPLGITGIATCPVGATPLCTSRGNLLTVNASTGVLYEIAVADDGTTPSPPLQKTGPGFFTGAQSLEFDTVSGDLLVAGHSPNFPSLERDRVWRVTQDLDFPAILSGCPFSMPSDATFATGGDIFVASRAPLTEALMDFVRGNQSPFDAASACPMPNIARVVGAP